MQLVLKCSCYSKIISITIKQITDKFSAKVAMLVSGHSSDPIIISWRATGSRWLYYASVETVFKAFWVFSTSYDNHIKEQMLSTWYSTTAPFKFIPRNSGITSHLNLLGVGQIKPLETTFSCEDWSSLHKACELFGHIFTSFVCGEIFLWKISSNKNLWKIVLWWRYDCMLWRINHNFQLLLLRA